MGKQRIRKRRRRRFYKPNVAVSLLTCITIILLFVWGGLYWKESSNKNQLVNASAQDQGQQISQGEEGLPLLADNNSYEEIGDALQTLEEADDLGGENADVADDSDGSVSVVKEEASSQTQEKETTVPQIGKINDSDTLDTRKPDTSSSSMKPETNSSSKPNESGSTKSETLVSVKPNEQDQSPTESNSSTPLETGSSSTTKTSPVVSKVEKYEEEFTNVQGKCTKDTKVVLSKAESNAQQMDKQDPRVVLAWRDNLDTELATAKSTCEGTFQELIQTAENDQVSLSVVEQWKQTYNDLRVKLQEESEAKLKEIMGG
ncbi:hypothetical protein J2T12_000231 [Paenibacillus anaericanus]|uniref:hypothetical protein n=1 Tax=Paenibacillus anaericanus TaxID=170367 RepID=UPI00277FEA2F|nr:hypothetical protein [Paenibacillus anaericanus]MDQ0086837.1 hypothetical protein [Paenibacillus anaericanus]